MTPVFLFILLLSLTGVAPGATDDGGNEVESSDASENIEKANARTSKKLIYGDIVPNFHRNADPCTATGCKWRKYGRYVKVPVMISRAYNRREYKIIIDSLKIFHKSTCIRFVPWRPWNPWHHSFLYIYSGSGCFSWLGRQSSRGQVLSLERNGCLYTSTVQHELLHALGFHHEQVRSDRDSYVEIHNENIQPGMERNFWKVRTNNLGTPYDYNSIMHYFNYAFSKNRMPTITAKGNPNLPLGRAIEMTANDIDRVNKLYQC